MAGKLGSVPSKVKPSSNFKASWGNGSQNSNSGAAISLKPKAKDTLMLGEGNFSYARSLVEAGKVNPKRLVATSFETGAIPGAAKNIAFLQARGVKVLRGVYGTNLAGTFKGSTSFDNIIFHFPHTGGSISSNQALLRGFFGNARGFLASGGEVNVTLSRSMHYNRWGIKTQAASGGFSFTGRSNFSGASFPNYRHMQTNSPSASATSNGYIYSFGF